MAKLKIAHNKKRFSETELESARKYAQCGLDIRRIAYLLNVHPSTLQRHINDDSPIGAYIEKGRSEAAAMVTSALFKKAVGGNVVAMIYYTKAVLKWRENDAVDNDEGDVKEFKLAYTTKRKMRDEQSET